MDQGQVIAIDGRRHGWTPLRVLLAVLGAVIGGVLLTFLSGGLSAHADAPDGPPALLGPVVGGTASVEQHTLQSVAPLTAPLDTALTAVLPESAVGATAPIPPGTGTSAASTVDGIVDRSPVASAPLWNALIGPRPIAALLAPVRAGIHHIAPTLMGLADPVLGTGIAASLGIAELQRAMASGRPLADAGGAIGAEAVMVPGNDPATMPAGSPPAPTAALSNAGSSPLLPAATLGALALLLLALAKTRRDTGLLPSSPVYETDSSPD